MAISRETRDLIALWIMSLYDSRYVWGYPGRRNLDGTVDFEVPGRPGMTYVTLWRGQKLVVDMAVNLGANPNPNLLVQMERVRGVLTIVRPDPSAAAHLYGFLAGMAAIPPFYPAVGTGLTDPVEGRRFVPGLIAPSPAGGLAVQIFPFHHSGGYFPGDSQFEIDDPASDYAAVGVYVDTATNTASYIVGDTHADPAEIDDAALFDDLSAVPTSGIVRCGAVLVQAGQTAITTEDTFFDWRWHLDESVGRLLSEAAETLTLSSGAITAGSGSYILIAAESGTADDLDTLTVTGTPRLIILQADTGDTITVKHGVGNIKLNGETDFALSGDKTLALFWDGTNLSDVGIGIGAALEYSGADVSNPPTDAELDAEFGTPATVGGGFGAILDDGGADTSVYLVASNGTSWWYVAMTKAT
jgi:hypothetical protein